jgi:hypothetical protein
VGGKDKRTYERMNERTKMYEAELHDVRREGLLWWVRKALKERKKEEKKVGSGGRNKVRNEQRTRIKELDEVIRIPGTWARSAPASRREEAGSRKHETRNKK